MAEILTESFCERCGTRYTFESAAPRAAKLKGIRVLSRGLKNFVMSDDSSMDEAMAAARSETDREQTSQQLDAFHKTFNFCMTCRQYTCGNCWNEAEGRCLTCAPHLGHGILPSPFPDVDGHVPLGLENGRNGEHGSNGSQAVDLSSRHGPSDLTEALAWPTMDLDRDDPTAMEVDGSDIEPIDASARLAAIGAYDVDAPVEVAAQIAPAVEISATTDGGAQSEPPVSATPVPEPVETVESPAPPAELAPSPDPVDAADVPGRAAAAAAQTTDFLRRFRPGQNLDAEIEAYEREQDGALDAPIDHEPAAAEWPVAAEAETPEPVVVQATEASEAPAPIAEPSPREDVVPQPTWRVVAPETQPSTGPIGEPARPDAISPTAEPQWPANPEWPSQRPASGLAFLGRPALPTGGLESLWAESAREVAAPTAPPTIGAAPARGASGGVQPCVSCGLSLSATARFCRRCGTPQG